MAEEPNFLQQLGEEAAAVPVHDEGDALARLKTMATRVLTIDEQIEELEKRLSERKVMRYDILTRQMVDIMDAEGVSVESLEVDGRLFVVEDFYHASIKKDAENAAEAYKWLEDHGAGDIIKIAVTATFGKDADELVRQLVEYIQTRYGDSAVVSVEKGVPWKRLTEWLKERDAARRAAMEAGALELPPEAIVPPLDLIGGAIERRVKVEDSRKKKKSRRA